MAFFAVPSEWEGKTLRQVANEIQSRGGYVPRLDLVANMLGVNENTPLRSGMSMDVKDDPGSGEYQFLKANFNETTREALAAEQYTKALQGQIDEETKWVDKYLADNPFVFDEQLAKESATAEYEPYYQELLKDYLQDVSFRKESVQDEQKLLRQLRTLDVQSRSRSRDYAVEQAEKGYEGRGLFSSGMRARSVGRTDIDYKTGMEEAGARYGSQETGLNRQLEEYGVGEERKSRDIGRAQEASVAGGIEQRRGESYKGYYTPLVTAYQRRFPTGSRGVDQYLPPDYLKY